MKKQFTNAIEKKVFGFLLALVVIFTGSASAFAGPGKAVNTIKNVEISYSGVKDKMLVFKLDYKNEAAEPFQLLIKNEHNEIIFSKWFQSKPLNTDVYLSEVPDNAKLTFSILSGKKDFSQAFEINTNVKTVEDYIVKGL